MNARTGTDLWILIAACIGFFALGWDLGSQHGYAAHRTQAIKDQLAWTADPSHPYCIQLKAGWVCIFNGETVKLYDRTGQLIREETVFANGTP